MLYVLRDEKDKVIDKDFISNDRSFTDLILKNREKVLLYLNKNLERVKTLNGSKYLLLKNDTLYDFIRPDPRFQAILAKHKKLYDKNLEKYMDLELSWKSDNKQ